MAGAPVNISLKRGKPEIGDSFDLSLQLGLYGFPRGTDLLIISESFSNTRFLAFSAR